MSLDLFSPFCWPVWGGIFSYSPQRLESACRKALSYTTSPSLKSVQSILKSGQDKLLDKDTPARPEEPKAHKFTRGAGYYKRGE